MCSEGYFWFLEFLSVQRNCEDKFLRETRKAYSIFVGKHLGKQQMEDRELDGLVVLRWVLNVGIWRWLAGGCTGGL
jgi:uncharacterized membrane protein YedE/YeeE